jgi:hypothetical protein
MLFVFASGSRNINQLNPFLLHSLLSFIGILDLLCFNRKLPISFGNMEFVNNCILGLCTVLMVVQHMAASPHIVVRSFLF